jgi:endonuclease YncB( thermonuclease family)
VAIRVATFWQRGCRRPELLASCLLGSGAIMRHSIITSICFATVLILGSAFDDTRANDLTGIPHILDGDTVAINGIRVRLQGIDAPEMEQFCLDNKGRRADCGKGVRDRLREKSAGRAWTCKVLGQDVYSRSLARCNVGGEDIQKWLVRSGFALSYKQYSHDYDADEQAARNAHAGLWSGAFIAPWDWRHRNTSTEILGAVSVPLNAQKILLRPDTIIPKGTTPAPKVNTTAVTTTHSRGGCGSRGGPGYRLANGKCASWHKSHKHRKH